MGRPASEQNWPNLCETNLSVRMSYNLLDLTHKVILKHKQQYSNGRGSDIIYFFASKYTLN